MILSGPKAWRGSMKEVRILPHFLHSAAGAVSHGSRGFAIRPRSRKAAVRA